MSEFGYEDPLDAWSAWYAEAAARETDVPDAMQLATVDPDGQPRLRTVLSKAVDAAGIVFYTNLLSRKGQDLSHHSRVALTWHWKSLERQVHVEGRVRPVSSREADAYHASRGRRSQVGAHVSQQSRPLDSRRTLERAVADFEAAWEGKDIPRPEHWSGFRVVPDRWEFWQGQPSRLHDRFEFIPDGAGWAVQRLWP